MNPNIPAVTDNKLVDHNTTEHSCECPGLFYKTDLNPCPWTGDLICRHMYRYRLKMRLEAAEKRFQELLDKAFELYGEAAERRAMIVMVPRSLKNLRIEVARVEVEEPPLPRKKKEREAAMAERALAAELQELRVC